MHKKRALTIGIAALAIAAPVAQANPANSIQPAHVYFGAVHSGSHPNRIVRLHNGTGALERITSIGVSGSGGGKFTLVGKSALIDATLLPRCVVGMRLGVGGSCVFDVRVHTTRVGWWRSVLGVHFDSGNFGSAELRAHVVAP